MTNNYFEQLDHALKLQPRAIPRLLVDLDVVDQNIATFREGLGDNIKLRIPVKSLPSLELVKYLMAKVGTDNLMVFHQPFLTDLTSKVDDKVDILLGKPMPVKTAHYYYQNLPEITNDFNPYCQIQWLVDTTNRIEQYANLAQELDTKLRLNVEIDVGLHRGGFTSIEDLRKGLELFEKYHAHIEFSGFMGYDPQVVKIPKVLRSQNSALKMSVNFYDECKSLVEGEFPKLWTDNLTFNGAGSPTIALHKTDDSPLNDVGVGSCFVKPTTFDIPTLEAYKPACFIATPVLKKFEGTTLPGIEKFKSILNFQSKANAQSFFIYGGFWKADYCYPNTLQENALFGSSTNQTMVNAAKNIKLAVDDFVFLRPHQSEFVFLQFGKLLIVRTNKIIDEWSILNNSL